MKILQILSSAKGENSVSTKLANAIVKELQAAHPGSTVTVKDLAALQPAHLEPGILGAFFAPAAVRTPEQSAAVAFSDTAIQEVKDADVIVVGLAFYNYTIASSLKAWIDHISRAGITFKYNEHGQQVGLLDSKTIYVGVASGGIYRESPMKEMDFATPYFTLAMKMIGLNDTRFFYADGQGVPVYQLASLDKAIASIKL